MRPLMMATSPRRSRCSKSVALVDDQRTRIEQRRHRVGEHHPGFPSRVSTTLSGLCVDVTRVIEQCNRVEAIVDHRAECRVGMTSSASTVDVGGTTRTDRVDFFFQKQLTANKQVISFCATVGRDPVGAVPESQDKRAEQVPVSDNQNKQRDLSSRAAPLPHFDFRCPLVDTKQSFP